MAYEGSQPVRWTFVAGGDLSSSQYKFVKLNTSGQVVDIAATTDTVMGVLQNNPKQNQEALVCIAGITKVQGDIDLAKADPVTTSSDGQATTSTFTAGDKVVGVVLLDNSAAGGLATITINCLAPTKV